MLAVADASPLILLARLDALELLPKLYDRIVVPVSVFDEATIAETPGASEIRRAEGWLEIWRRPIRTRPMASALGLGEIDALSLAKELAADEVLIDERRGRAEARRMGLSTRGTSGVLVVAKRQGHIERVAPYFERLAAMGARVHPSIYRQLLESVGELGSV